MSADPAVRPVPVADAGGIQPERVAPSGILGEMGKQALGQRRAADIAAADEQDGVFMRLCHDVCAIS